jgi:hypothetical protein
MRSIDCVKKEIETIIAASPVPEDPIHSKNTLEWLLRLKPDADEAFKLAALGHDIDRAVNERKVRRVDFEDFDEFKDAHARNSADILREVMVNCGVEGDMVEEVCRLVRLHEKGGDLRSDLLKDADGISYFDVNLPLYFERNGWDETKRRSVWGYRRLSKRMMQVAAGLSYENEELNRLIISVVKEA